VGLEGGATLADLYAPHAGGGEHGPHLVGVQPVVAKQPPHLLVAAGACRLRSGRLPAANGVAKPQTDFCFSFGMFDLASEVCTRQF